MSIAKMSRDPLRITKLADYDVKMRSNKIRDIQTDNFAITIGFAQNLEQNIVPSADQPLLYQGRILKSEF